MPQFYINPSEYALIMGRFEYIIDTLIKTKELKNEKPKAASEAFRYMVNRMYFVLKTEEIENNNKDNKEAI